MPSPTEDPIEIGLDDSDKEGEVDAPGKVVFATLAMDEDYEEDAPTFAYNAT